MEEDEEELELLPLVLEDESEDFDSLEAGLDAVLELESLEADAAGLLPPDLA